MNIDFTKTDLYEEIYKMLSEKRRKHTEGVIETTRRLSRLYGGDEQKAVIASAVHDLYRGKTKEELDEEIDRYGIDTKYKGNANLAHGPVAAAAIQKKFGINDMEIVNAVAYHTTGRANMSLLEKIVYLADAIEPGREYPGVDEIRSLAEQDLDEAVLAMMEHTVEFLNQEGKEIDIDTLTALEFLKERKEG